MMNMIQMNNPNDDIYAFLEKCGVKKTRAMEGKILDERALFIGLIDFFGVQNLSELRGMCYKYTQRKDFERAKTRIAKSIKGIFISSLMDEAQAKQAMQPSDPFVELTKVFDAFFGPH